MDTIIQGHLDIDNSSLIKRVWDTKFKYDLTGDKPQKHPIYVNMMSSKVNVANTYEQEHWADINPHFWPEMKPIIDTIAALTDVNTIRHSWLNISKTGGYIAKHHHDHDGTATHAVFVYYIHCTSEHSSVEFEIDGVWTEYKCVSGDWLYFPKRLPHRVAVNNGPADRMSISINI